MIERTLRISGEDMTRGLAPKDLGFGSPYATALLNLKPEEEGLRGYERLNDPFDGGVSVNWPFPQCFETQEGLLLFQESSVSEITHSTSPWGLSPVTTYDPERPSTTKPIPSGASWHVAPFGSAWYATNGSSLVYRTGLDSLSTGSSPKTFVGDEITMNTVAAQKGRVFMGGFSDDLWERTFETFFSDWNAQTGLSPEYNEIDQSWIAYSSIGGGDLPMWLFHPSGYATDVSPSKDRVLDRFEKNELGFLPLPTTSEVLALEPLGSNLVAYCEEATFLIQLEFPRTEEVAATVGRRKLLDVGIHSRSAVGGSERGHTFLGQFGDLWRIAPDGETQNLGYRNHMREHIGQEECLVWESSHNNYIYISSSISGFLLTEQGLCEITESPTFVLSRRREDKGLALEQGEHIAQFVGPETDFGDRGLKTATSIACGYRGDAVVECGFDYRYTPDGHFRRTETEDNLRTDAGNLRRTDAEEIRTLSAADVTQTQSLVLQTSSGDIRTSDDGSTRNLSFSSSLSSRSLSATDILQPVNDRGIAYVRQSGGAFRFVIEADDPAEFDLDYIELRFQLDDARHQRGPRTSEVAS